MPVWVRSNDGLGIAVAPRPKPADGNRSTAKNSNRSGNANGEGKDGLPCGSPNTRRGTRLQLVLAGESKYSVDRERAQEATNYGWPK